MCQLGFKLIGSSVDENGFLAEPFGLLPISWMFISLGLVLLIIRLAKFREAPLSQEAKRQV